MDSVVIFLFRWHPLYADKVMVELIRALAGGAASNVVIGPAFQFTPWSHRLPGFAWNSNGTLYNVSSGVQNSVLILHPAPGEVISLGFDVLDDLLNQKPTILSLTVRSMLLHGRSQVRSARAANIQLLFQPNNPFY